MGPGNDVRLHALHTRTRTRQYHHDKRSRTSLAKKNHLHASRYAITTDPGNNMNVIRLFRPRGLYLVICFVYDVLSADGRRAKSNHHITIIIIITTTVTLAPHCATRKNIIHYIIGTRDWTCPSCCVCVSAIKIVHMIELLMNLFRHHPSTCIYFLFRVFNDPSRVVFI